jgi:hypothetical protein
MMELIVVDDTFGVAGQHRVWRVGVHIHDVGLVRNDSRAADLTGYSPSSALHGVVFSASSPLATPAAKKQLVMGVVY